MHSSSQPIALFRYGIIAPVLHAAAGTQSAYFRTLAEKDLEVPGLGRRRYSVATFKGWLRRYRRGGLDALLPRHRSDAGESRVLTAELQQRVTTLVQEHPELSVRRLREQLVATGQITSRAVSEATLARYIRAASLRPAPSSHTPQARRHFEHPHANDLWVLDFMHGPKVELSARRLTKTYLAAAVDDHSRFLTLARFYPQETTAAVMTALQQAFARHGLPRILYCDNGSAFSSQALQLACARLGIALVHSQPYDPASRGKIERWFRTLRSQFLAALGPQRLTLDELNLRLQHWIETDYLRRRHSGIGECPLDRYLRSLASIRPRLVTPAELDHVFYVTLERTVRKDATVSIARRRWEVPPDYIGRRIEIRHPQARPGELFLFENNQPVARLHQVDAAANATSPRRPRFILNLNEEEES